MRRALALTPLLVLACAGSSPPATQPPTVVVAEAPAGSASSSWRPATVAPGAHRASSGWRARLRECTPDDTPVAFAREQFKNAVQLFAEDRYPQALAIFVQLYRQTCTPPLLYNIAIALERTGDRDGAADVLELFLEREPDSPRTTEARARLEALRQAP